MEAEIEKARKKAEEAKIEAARVAAEKAEDAAHAKKMAKLQAALASAKTEGEVAFFEAAEVDPPAPVEPEGDTKKKGKKGKEAEKALHSGTARRKGSQPKVVPIPPYLAGYNLDEGARPPVWARPGRTLRP